MDMKIIVVHCKGWVNSFFHVGAAWMAAFEKLLEASSFKRLPVPGRDQKITIFKKATWAHDPAPHASKLEWKACGRNNFQHRWYFLNPAWNTRRITPNIEEGARGEPAAKLIQILRW